MSIANFSTEIFQSPQRLQQFFEGREAIKEIIKKRDELPVTTSGNLGARDVVWFIVQTPFVVIYYTFLSTISTCCYIFGAKSLSMQYQIAASHCSSNMNHYEHRSILGDRLLVQAINSPRLDTADVYTHPSVKTSDLGTRVRPLIFSSKPTINFAVDDGKCRGMSDWFAYLYFKTRSKFSDEKQHLRAVASIFSQGATREAQVLQEAFPDNEFCLGLKKNYSKDITVFKEDCLDSENYYQRIAKIFQSLKPGMYAFVIPRHRMNLIKSHKTSYVFDPNIGLIDIKNTNDLKRFCRAFHRREGHFSFTLVDHVARKAFSRTAEAA